MTHLPTPSDLYQAYKHRTKKRFGQHFLTNASILDTIVAIPNITPDTHILEIGPGCGTLTTTLMQTGARVSAIEIDLDAANYLKETLVPFGLNLIEGNALDIDITKQMNDSADAEQRWICVSNLPYNFATPLTLKLLDTQKFHELVLMYQKEVALRLCAQPRSSAYGSLTLATQFRAKTELSLSLAPGAFTPPPKVTSAVVHLQPHPPESLPPQLAAFEGIIQAAFQQRRKTLINSLKRVGYQKENLIHALDILKHKHTARPEELSLSDWNYLCKYLLSTTPNHLS